jgi:hypothetical protein
MIVTPLKVKILSFFKGIFKYLESQLKFVLKIPLKNDKILTFNGVTIIVIILLKFYI